MELKNCPACGAKNSGIAKFCYACGADLRNEEQKAPDTAQTAETAQPAQTVGGQLPPNPQMPPQNQPYGSYQMPPQGAPYGRPDQQPIYPSNPPFVPLGYRQKSRTAAGILGILLGVFGAHNFYLGYTGKAVAQLLLTILSSFLLSPVSFIWGLVEGIRLLNGEIQTDGRHVPLSD